MGKKAKSKTKSKAPPAAASAASSAAPARRNAVLDTANAVRDVMADFAAFARFSRSGLDARLVNVHAAELSVAQREAIMGVFEANMKTMYEHSDWGYDAAAKRAELFEDEARYLLAVGGAADAGLLGFVHFRFVEDDGAEVLYIYEIQIAAPAQRKGLGKLLMQLLTLVARRHGMQLVVLTVFKSNVAAMQFYRQKLGFEIDETSPSAHGDASQSYEILSKSVVAGKR